jgi:predicted aldo/keto reductase-like oxidoreductase
MRYRHLPKDPELEVSTLGFGCMRLPTIAGDPARIDEPAARQLLDEALEAGVNYVDTAWSYHQGTAEPCIGRALKGRRERVRLAAKLPVRLVEREGDFERLLDEQLARLATDRVDFYLLEALGRDRWALAKRLRGIQAMERARVDGRVGHLGFSFLGGPDELAEILDGHDWDLCQLPLDLLEQRPAGLEALRHAAARGLGVVVTEPLHGGVLGKPPPVLREVWASSSRPWSPAEWALRWAWDQPGVVTVLAGTGSSSHLRENVRAAGHAAPLAPEDLRVIEDARRTYRSKRRVPCSSCGGCGVCPNQLPVPDLFSLYNDGMFQEKAAAAEEYRQAFLERGLGADRCSACGACEPNCPQAIRVAERLEEAHAYLTRPASNNGGDVAW